MTMCQQRPPIRLLYQLIQDECLCSYAELSLKCTPVNETKTYPVKLDIHYVYLSNIVVDGCHLGLLLSSLVRKYFSIYSAYNTAYILTIKTETGYWSISSGIYLHNLDEFMDVIKYLQKLV